MKQTYSCIKVIAFIVTLMLSLNSFATGPRTLSMTYTYVSTNTYDVDLYATADCSGLTLSLSAPLFNYGIVADANSCIRSTQSTSATLISRSTVKMYCGRTSVFNNCSNSNPMKLIELFHFRARVTLPATPGLYKVSYNGLLREVAANYSAANGYSEVLINTLYQNSTPRFDSKSFAVKPSINNRASEIKFGEADLDGDSVVYELTEPLVSCSQTVSMTQIAYANPPANCQPLLKNYTAQVPIYTFGNQYTLGNLGSLCFFTGQPRHSLDAATGTFTFVTTKTVLNTPSRLNLNDYVVAVKASEYRKVNGRPVLVGSSIREALVLVYPNYGAPAINISPNQFMFDSTRRVYRHVINQLPMGAPLQFTFATSMSAFDTVRLSYSPDSLVIAQPASIPTSQATLRFVNNGGYRPALEIDVNPNAQMNGQVYTFKVYANRDICPINVTETYTIKLVFGGVTTTQSLKSATIKLSPNPASGQVQLEGAAGLTYHINNALGQKQLTGLVSSDVEFVNIKDLKTGLHFVTLSNGKQLKFVKE